MTDHEPRELDALLSASSPATSEHGPVRTAALETMARDARPSRGRRVRRPVLVGAGALALVFAGGMGASAAFDWHLPWQNDAAGSYVYTLPSGAECSGILGNVQGPANIVAATNAFMARSDLLDVIDVDAAIAFLRANPMTHVLPDGSEVAVVPGSPYWTADYEYELAFQKAFQDGLRADLAAEGYDLNSLTSFEEGFTCPGADNPDWMDQAGG
ncbi:hypothetical protein [Demequina sp.]|uniref:hypothetical protein n=1 Tax=Demequina sp. TaxID=2050685 RepID=UPI0025C52ED4|nr:hypothetical protein [Demequina sp.]